MAAKIEYFENEQRAYCPSYLLCAEFTESGQLFLQAKPTADLHLVMQEIREEIIELVNLEQHLDIHLYQVGNKHVIEISIN